MPKPPRNILNECKQIFFPSFAQIRSPVSSPSPASFPHYMTHSEESAICPFPHIWSLKYSQLASVTVTDIGQIVCNPSYWESMANFTTFASGHGWLWHHRDSNLQSPNDRAYSFLLWHSGGSKSSIILKQVFCRKELRYLSSNKSILHSCMF